MPRRAAPQLPGSGRRRSGKRCRAAKLPLSRLYLWLAGVLPWLADADGERLGGHLGGLLRIVGDGHQVEVLWRDRAASEHHLPHPAEQTGPVLGPIEDDRKVLDLARLGKGQRLEELVEGAQTAGKDDEAASVFDEHVLADEEVAELDAEGDVVVELLLVGQLDVAADRQPAGLLAPAVDGFHDPRAAAGDDGETAPRQRGPKGPARGVVRIIRRRAG